MKLFGKKSNKEKRTTSENLLSSRSTFEQSLEYPEFKNFILNKDKKESFKQDVKNFVLFWKPYKRIVGYGIRYASDEIRKKKWREVYGILVGSIKKNFVLIKDAIPMVAGDRAGVEYEDKQYVDMAEIDYKIYEKALKDKKNDFIIGWWHTHPGYGFFFSPVDSLTQLGYQSNNPHAIGLIFDHTQKGKRSLGIAGLRLKDTNRGVPAGYEKVKLYYRPGKKEFLNKINNVVNHIQKNQEKINSNLECIEEQITNRGITKLQEMYGVIPVPKSNVENSPSLWKPPEESYTWNMDEEDIQYINPPFRESLEEKIAYYKKLLTSLKESGKLNLYVKKRAEFIKFVLDLLEKPKNATLKIIKDLNQKMEHIQQYWDFLDTDERLLCNNAFKQITKYTETISKLEESAISKIS
jgi:proteasome lid subunit RPN8/RPN11